MEICTPELPVPEGREEPDGMLYVVFGYRPMISLF